MSDGATATAAVLDHIKLAFVEQAAAPAAGGVELLHVIHRSGHV